MRSIILSQCIFSVGERGKRKTCLLAYNTYHDQVLHNYMTDTQTVVILYNNSLLHVYTKCIVLHVVYNISRLQYVAYLSLGSCDVM